MRRTLFALTAALALLAAACAGGGSGTEVESVADSTSSSTTTSIDPQGEEEIPAELAAELAVLPLPDSDMALPAELPPRASGAPGFTHFVFEEIDGAVTPVLVEGPTGEQFRCQDPDMPCSYFDLKDLQESGDPIPDGVGLTADELDELMAQLGDLRTALGSYRDPNVACAEGFRVGPQIPNMGAHFTRIDRVLDGVFNPSEPEILLYIAGPDDDPSEAFAGGCREGEWQGSPDIQLIGASFLQPPNAAQDHPEGFVGNIDNWHVHYNLCNASFSVKDRAACEGQGGSFAETLGWMIHTWVPPECPDSDPDCDETAYDNQSGVFAQWNPTLWPVLDPVDLEDRWRAESSDGPVSVIANFDYDDITVEAGEEVVFSNNDGLPHTVTAGEWGDTDGDFNTGLLGPGQTATLTFDEPGVYQFYCALHSNMAGTITVE